MGALTGQDLVTELQRRVANLSDDHALAALNRAQHWALRQGSYSFMMTAPTSLTVTSQVAPKMAAEATSSATLDLGKAKMMFNTDGTPIKHVPMSDFWQSVNYNIPVGTMYDTYTVNQVVVGTQGLATFYFLPNVTGTAYLYAHRASTGISLGSYTDLPADFDDLIVDLAEAEERRIYDVGDSWQLLLQRSQDQIKVLLDGYRSSTMQETNLSDATVKAQETIQLGRN